LKEEKRRLELLKIHKEQEELKRLEEERRRQKEE
jgi:hypothetical protein